MVLRACLRFLCFNFFLILGHPDITEGLLLALHLSFNPGGLGGLNGKLGNQTWAGCMPGKHLTHYILGPAPFKNVYHS